MEKLNDIELQSGKIELTYTGIDAAGNRVEKVKIYQPDPAWAAVLLRYLEDHKAHGQYAMGSKAIPLQGSAGDFPTVERSRWEPSGPFIG